METCNCSTEIEGNSYVYLCKRDKKVLTIAEANHCLSSSCSEIVSIDVPIHQEILRLWKAGIQTYYCCAGHCTNIKTTSSKGKCSEKFRYRKPYVVFEFTFAVYDSYINLLNDDSIKLSKLFLEVDRDYDLGFATLVLRTRNIDNDSTKKSIEKDIDNFRLSLKMLVDRITEKSASLI